MAVFRLSLPRLLLGAALVLAPSSVLAQAPGAVAPASPSPSAPASAPAPAARAPESPPAPVARASALESAPASAPVAVAGASLAEPTSASAPEPVPEPSASARAARAADELSRELGGTPPEAAEEPESLGWTLVRTVLLLGAVLASVYLTLNVGLRRLMGLQGVPMGRPSVVSVLERVPLDQRRTLFVLKAADEYLLVGGGESGLQLLSKLDREAVERIRAERPTANVVTLSPFLQKLLSRRTGGTPPPGV